MATNIMKKSEFDTIILNNLKEKGYGPFGYLVQKNFKNNKTYNDYYDYETFEKEKNKMSTKYLDQFGGGKGGELNENNGKPPKMASVASSSRFAYLSLRYGAEAIGGTNTVEFEHECRTAIRGGTHPQLDAFSLDKNNNPIYVEAKCHEIFDPHKSTLSLSYENILFGENNAFGFNKNEMQTENNKIKIPFASLGIGENSMIDVKQFFCHLMGIGHQIKKKNYKSATLVYLFFRPAVQETTENFDKLEKLFSDLTNEAKALFTSTPIRNFCNTNKINLKMIISNSDVMGKLPANIKPCVDIPHI